jgi:hypothetical protein
MTPEGYAVVHDHSGFFSLRYYPDVNRESVYMQVTMSRSYDDIMRALLQDREMRGIGKEYWIS